MKNICLLLLILCSYSFADTERLFPKHTEMKMQTILIHYGKASYFKKMIEDAKLKSSRGKIICDTRRNALIIIDEFKQNKAITQFISDCDKPLKQILIVAKIIALDSHYEEELGIDWGIPNLQIGISHLHLSSVAGLMTPFGANFSETVGGNILDIRLAALESTGAAKLISSPRIVTIEQQSALIETGDVIPYQEQTRYGGTSVSFKKAVLSLKVKPVVQLKNELMLSIQVDQNKATGWVVSGVPAISTRSILSQLRVKNGETVAIGGIYEQSFSQTKNQIPGVNSWPIIGKLFEHQRVTDARKELIIFITPHILS